MAESKRDLLPEHFASIKEVGDFWDTHDLTDYTDLTEEVTATIDLQRRRDLVDKLVRGQDHGAARQTGVFIEHRNSLMFAAPRQIVPKVTWNRHLAASLRAAAAANRCGHS